MIIALTIPSLVFIMISSEEKKKPSSVGYLIILYNKFYSVAFDIELHLKIACTEFTNSTKTNPAIMTYASTSCQKNKVHPVSVHICNSF